MLATHCNDLLLRALSSTNLERVLHIVVVFAFEGAFFVHELHVVAVLHLLQLLELRALAFEVILLAHEVKSRNLLVRLLERLIAATFVATDPGSVSVQLDDTALNLQCVLRAVQM